MSWLENLNNWIEERRPKPDWWDALEVVPPVGHEQQVADLMAAIVAAGTPPKATFHDVWFHEDIDFQWPVWKRNPWNDLRVEMAAGRLELLP